MNITSDAIAALENVNMNIQLLTYLGKYHDVKIMAFMVISHSQNFCEKLHIGFFFNDQKIALNIWNNKIIFLQKENFSQNSQKFSTAKITDYTVTDYVVT